MRNLRILRQRKGMSQSQVAQYLGCERSTYAKYESGASEPAFEALQRLSQLFGEPVDFLMGVVSAAPSAATGKKIPVLGDVAAGIPVEAITDIVDYEEIDAAMAAAGEYFGLRIKGDSMEPRMREGDVVIVRKQDNRFGRRP